MAHISPNLFQTFLKPYTLQQREEAIARIEALKAIPKESLDQIINMICLVTGASMGTVNIVDSEAVKVLCQTGQLQDSYAHEESFCAYAVLQPDTITVIEDASKDVRFARHAIVTGHEHIRFYAGAHIQAPGGMPVATVCGYDTQPRILSREQKSALSFLAQALGQRLELAIRNTRAEQEKAKFEAFMDNGPAIAFLKDHEGRYTYVNRHLLDYFQLEANEILGKRDVELWPEVGEQLAAHDRWVMHQHGPVEVTEEGPPNARGEPTWWRSYKFPIPGTPPMLGGLSLDITTLHATQEKIKGLAGIDLLTGLPNKQTLHRELPRLLDRHRENGRPFALLHIDIHRFKPFTEARGEAAGDAMVRRLADSLTRSIRPTDRAYHLRCDEFIVIIDPLPPVGDPTARCEEILSRSTASLHPTGQSTDTSISIGAVIFDGADTGAEALLSRASAARKNAKRQGGGCWIDPPAS